MKKIDVNRAHTTLQSQPIGHTIRYYGSVESTMSLARSALTQSGVDSAGLVIVAEEQTQGRGRQQRKWDTPYGKALLTSIIVGKTLLPTPLTHLSIAASVALRRALIHHLALQPIDDASTGQPNGKASAETARHTRHTPPSDTGCPVMFKWPNDILMGREAHKGAGILIELSFVESIAEHAILGIGINVNQEGAELPAVPTGARPPTSIKALTGRTVDRTDLLISLCKELSVALNECAPRTRMQSQPSAINIQHTEWVEHMQTLNQPVTVSSFVGNLSEAGDAEQAAQTFHGIAVGVTQEGYLIVENAQGERKTFSSGEVTLRSRL